VLLFERIGVDIRECLPRPKEAKFRGVFRDAEGVCRLGEGKSLIVPEDENGGVMLRQLVQRLLDIVLVADRAFNRFIRRIVLCSQEGDPANQLAPAEVGDRGISSDPVEPGLEVEVRPGIRERPVGLDEGVLGQVFGQGAISDHAVKVVEDRCVVPLE